MSLIYTKLNSRSNCDCWLTGMSACLFGIGVHGDFDKNRWDLSLFYEPVLVKNKISDIL